MSPETYELLGAIVASSAATAFINAIINYKQNKANSRLTNAKAKEAEIEAEEAEIEKEQKVSEFYKSEFKAVLSKLNIVQNQLLETQKQLSEAMVELEDNRKQMAVVLGMLRNKDAETCIRHDCPNKITSKKTKQNGKN